MHQGIPPNTAIRAVMETFSISYDQLFFAPVSRADYYLVRFPWLMLCRLLQVRCGLTINRTAELIGSNPSAVVRGNAAISSLLGTSRDARTLYRTVRLNLRGLCRDR
jgi:hypothetical protein